MVWLPDGNQGEKVLPESRGCFSSTLAVDGRRAAMSPGDFTATDLPG
jgi:hypothetical protein